MKKILVLSLVIAVLLTGCTHNKQDTKPTTPTTNNIEITKETKKDEGTKPEGTLSEEAGNEAIFQTFPEEFYFQSGAGAWSTDLHIEEDGTFSGLYHDSDMGDSGDKYPNGTIYFSDFHGKFSIPVKIDEYTYSMKLETITVEGNPGEEYYEDNIRYVYSEPYGLENADEILIYLPGAKTADLPEGFLSWTELAYAETKPETIPFFGLYNVNEEDGFVGYVE